MRLINKVSYLAPAFVFLLLSICLAAPGSQTESHRLGYTLGFWSDPRLVQPPEG